VRSRLTRKLQWKNTSHELALTFSRTWWNFSAGEVLVRERITKVNEIPRNFPLIATWHSFCLKGACLFMGERTGGFSGSRANSCFSGGQSLISVLTYRTRIPPLQSTNWPDISLAAPATHLLNWSLARGHVKAFTSSFASCGGATRTGRERRKEIGMVRRGRALSRAGKPGDRRMKDGSPVADALRRRALPGPGGAGGKQGLTRFEVSAMADFFDIP